MLVFLLWGIIFWGVFGLGWVGGEVWCVVLCRVVLFGWGWSWVMLGCVVFCGVSLCCVVMGFGVAWLSVVWLGGVFSHFFA